MTQQEIINNVIERIGIYHTCLIDSNEDYTTIECKSLNLFVEITPELISLRLKDKWKLTTYDKLNELLDLIKQIKYSNNFEKDYE